MNLVAINVIPGGFALTQKAWDMLGGYNYFIYRHDPKLIKVLQELGTEAEDKYCKIELVEVGDRYLITCSDYGIERVVTPDDNSEDWVRIW